MSHCGNKCFFVLGKEVASARISGVLLLKDKNEVLLLPQMGQCAVDWGSLVFSRWMGGER